MQGRVDLFGYSKGGEGSRSCQDDDNSSIFFGLAVPSQGQPPRHESQSNGLLYLSEDQNGRVEDWQSIQEDSDASSLLLLAGIMAKPTTTIPCHTP